MEEVNNQTPMENTPVENTQVITELQYPPSEKKKNRLIPILLIVLFILLSIFAYLFFTDKIDIGIKNPFSKEEVVEEEETEEEEVVDNETEELEEEQTEERVTEITTKEYINTEVGVRFEYPQDWKVEASSSCKPGECTDLWLSIYEDFDNKKFVFGYSLPAGSGPEMCYFSDSDIPDEVTMGSVYDNFVKIDENDTLRRTYGVNEGSNGPVQQYKVCKLGSNGIYSNWVKPGYISYNVNMERADAQDIIKLMDNITLSFEYTGEDYEI